jgi:hypothetical protein
MSFAQFDNELILIGRQLLEKQLEEKEFVNRLLAPQVGLGTTNPAKTWNPGTPSAKRMVKPVHVKSPVEIARENPSKAPAIVVLSFIALFGVLVFLGLWSLV